MPAWPVVSATHAELISRVSATNHARTYELSQARFPKQANQWQFQKKLDSDFVWDAFVLLALLEDHGDRHTILTVPHTGLQKDRFTTQMASRNERIIVEGQPEISHWCEKCMRVFHCEDGRILKVEAVVTDGLTIGHPCCSVARCTDPLANNRDRFCADHHILHKMCAVEGCEEPVRELTKTTGGKECTTVYKTCSNRDHQEMERLHKERSKANFQLTQKLMRQKVTHPNDAFAEARSAELVDLEDAEEWFEKDRLDSAGDG